MDHANTRSVQELLQSKKKKSRPPHDRDFKFDPRLFQRKEQQHDRRAKSTAPGCLLARQEFVRSYCRKGTVTFRLPIGGAVESRAGGSGLRGWRENHQDANNGAKLEILFVSSSLASPDDRRQRTVGSQFLGAASAAPAALTTKCGKLRAVSLSALASCAKATSSQARQVADGSGRAEACLTSGTNRVISFASSDANGDHVSSRGCREAAFQSARHVHMSMCNDSGAQRAGLI